MGDNTCTVTPRRSLFILPAINHTSPRSITHCIPVCMTNDATLVFTTHSVLSAQLNANGHADTHTHTNHLSTETWVKQREEGDTYRGKVTAQSGAEGGGKWIKMIGCNKKRRQKEKGNIIGASLREVWECDSFAWMSTKPGRLSTRPFFIVCCKLAMWFIHYWPWCKKTPKNRKIWFKV